METPQPWSGSSRPTYFRKLAYKLIDYGYIHAVKIGTTLKIPKISVINYVMEKEVKKVG